MPKYIVKNCPSIWTHSFNKNTWLCENGKDCKDIPDCLLKRIVELCKVIDTPCDNCDGIGYFDGCKDDDCSFYRLTKIHQLLEIEEVSE